MHDKAEIGRRKEERGRRNRETQWRGGVVADEITPNVDNPCRMSWQRAWPITRLHRPIQRQKPKIKSSAAQRPSL